MAYYNSDGPSRLILDPRIKVIAGAFESTIGRMLHHGWQFETHISPITSEVYIKGEYYGGAVFGYSIAECVYLNTKEFLALYAPPEIVVECTISRMLELPLDMSFITADVGNPIIDTRSYNNEVMLYQPNSDPTARPSELVVTPEDIPELLEKIRKAQNPRAKEILANERLRDDMSQLKLQARILSFPS